MSEHIPDVFGYDRNRAIFCSALLKDSQSLRAFQRNCCNLRAAIATMLGNTLAKFHSPVAACLVDRLPHAARHRVPTLLHYGSLDITSQHDPAGIYARIRTYPEYVKLIREVASRWQSNGLMHGDIRWDNILVDETENGLRMSLIDWELAGGGDVAWDLAGVIQSYLMEWSADLLETHELQDLVGRFWSAYTSGRELPRTNVTDLLRTTIAYAGCRLVQSTFEQHQFGTPLDASSLKLLQLSWNILRDLTSTEHELLMLHNDLPALEQTVSGAQ